MDQADRIGGAIDSLRSMLAADGYDLEVRSLTGEAATFEIQAGPEACADCLVPKGIMASIFASKLRECLGAEVPEIQLIYPGD